MSNKSTLISVILIASLLFSCNQTQTKIKNASALIEHAEQSKEDLRKADLAELEIQMKQLQLDVETNRKDYTDEQIKEIGRLQGRYAAILVKENIYEIKNSIKNLKNQMEGFIEGITDSTNDIK
jgi:hypothetical protein